MRITKMASAGIEDFERIFRPILICLRMTGIPLVPCQLYRWLWLFGLTTLAFTAAEVIFIWFVMVDAIVKESYSQASVQNNITTTTSFTFLILLSSHHMWTLGTQIALLIMAAWDFEKLWTVLHKSFILAERPLAHYHQIRLLSAAFLIILLGGSFYGIVKTLSLSLFYPYPFAEQTFRILSILKFLYTNLATTLYLTVGCMTYKLFVFWQKDVQQVLKFTQLFCPGICAKRFISSKLSHWKETFLYLGELIVQISQCFRLFLLLMIIRIFIVITMLPFLAASLADKVVSPSYALYLESSLHFAVLLAVAYIPWKIKKEIGNVSGTLRLLRPTETTDLKFVHQLSHLLASVAALECNISAMGFVHVDFALLPKLIGTMLTYVIILFQFQSAEEKTSD